jgi:hypothetical protein
MPVSEGPKLNLPRTLVFALGSVALGIGLLVLVVWLAGSGDVQFKLGDDTFAAGQAEARAETIARDRAPILFSSLSRSRPIYLQHLGDDPAAGWYAIDARSPSDPSGCEAGLTWDSAAQQFVDACAPDTVFPPDGEGLLQYGVTVDANGDIQVDLNQD